MITLEDYIRNNISIKYQLEHSGELLAEGYLNTVGNADYYQQLIDDYTTVGQNIDIHNNNLFDLYDIIDENLLSHDIDKLIKSLKFYYDDLKYKKLSNKSITSLCVKSDDINILKEFYHDEDIKDTLLFYNYNITTKEYMISDTRPIIYIEPLYPIKCNDEVYNKSSGILYHFCKIGSKNNILKTGLRCKSQSQYRLYPQRIYFFSGNSNTLYNDNNKQLLIDFFNVLNINPSRLGILKINLHKSPHIHFDFYKDELMGKVGNNSCFTYHNIPPDCIQDVTSDKLLKYLSTL